MTDFAGLAAWLRDALNTLEVAARAASEDGTGEWVLPHLNGEDVEDADGDLVARPEPFIDAALHIASNDPRSVLARIEADRAILALHAYVWQQQQRMPGEHVNSIGVTVPNFAPIPGSFACSLCSDADNGPEPAPCPTLRWLAYGHRHAIPGYLPDWAPLTPAPVTR